MCGDGHDHDHDHKHEHEQEALHIEPDVLANLADLELEFEKAEIEALRAQYKLLSPLFKRRSDVVAKIPEFWPRVLSASQTLDELITADDAKLFENNLIGINMVRPEAEKEGGDIRNFDITFTFSENEWMEDTVLTKHFTTVSVNGQTLGLASEPLNIKWKAGKDLSKGITKKAFDFYTAKKEELKAAPKDESKDKKKLAMPVWADLISDDDKSFFHWFSWWGESLNAIRLENEEAADEKEGEDEDDNEENWEDEEHDDEEESVFPGGGELAEYIVDDLFVNATKYLTETLTGGDDDSEFDDEDLEPLDSDEEEEMLEKLQGGSSKKRKADESSEEPETKKSKA